MPIRSLNMPKYHAPTNEVLVGVIVRKLYGQGYPCCDARDVVMLIEKHHMDVSQFEFPDDNYELFKENFLLGKYGIASREISDAKRKSMQEKIQKGYLDVYDFHIE